ncbi:opacity family porin, partial [Neisseria gonorrhoeae]
SRRLGFGAMAGVGIDVAPGLTLDAGYRYHYWGRLENTGCIRAALPPSSRRLPPPRVFPRAFAGLPCCGRFCTICNTCSILKQLVKSSLS